MFQFLISLNPYSYPTFVAGMGFLLIGLFVLFKNPKNKINIAFFLMTGFSAGWLLGYTVVYNTQNADMALIFSKITYSSVMMIAVCIMHFFALFLGLEQKFKKFIIFSYLFSVFFSFINLTTSLIIGGEYKYFWGYYPDINTILGSFFLAFFLFLLVLVQILNWRQYFLIKKQSTPIEFNKIKFIVFGLSIYMFAIIDFIPGYGIKIYPFGYVFALAFTAITAYAIFRYQAIEIETVFHKTFLWSVILLMTTLPIFGIYLLLGDWIKERDILEKALFSVALVYIFSWYRSKIKPYIDNFFRRRAYDYYGTLLTSTEEISRTVNLQEATEKFINNIKNALYPKKAFILIKEEGLGYISTKDGKINLPIKHPLYLLMEKSRYPMQKEEIKSNQSQEAFEETTQWFKDNEIEIVIPLLLKDEPIGLLALGEKENLKPYTLIDLDLLLNIGKIIGVVFSNLLNYEKLIKQEREQKIKLENSVAERTRDLKVKMEELEKTKTALYNILEDFKLTNKVLQTEQDKIKTIISSMGEGLIVVDKDYKIVLFNTMAGKLLKTSGNELIGRDIRETTSLLRGGQKVAHNDLPLTKMFNTGEIISTGLDDDFYYSLPSGEKFPVAVAIAPLKGDNITGAVMIFRDITPEKNLDEARTSFVSVASHQLRTPLTAIQWNLELLMSKETGTLADMQRKFTADAYEETEKLIETINVLLSLARAESGSINIEPTPVAVVDFTRAIAKKLAPLCAKKEIALTVREPEHSVPPIMLDAPMLREVIMNIFSNAIRYSNPHGTVEVIFEIGDNAVTVLVKDNGIGIPSSQHSRVFEKFFRADNAVRKTTEGTGLGLNLVKTLVTLWRGAVWFTSEEGKGTTFYFTIPYEGMKEKREGKPIAV